MWQDGEIRNMTQDHDLLLRLAEDRRRRIAANGRPVFHLTDDEIGRSTHQAMRLAQASASTMEHQEVLRAVASCLGSDTA
jgi:hypothetical protein